MYHNFFLVIWQGLDIYLIFHFPLFLLCDLMDRQILLTDTFVFLVYNKFFQLQVFF